MILSVNILRHGHLYWIKREWSIWCTVSFRVIPRHALIIITSSSIIHFFFIVCDGPSLNVIFFFISNLRYFFSDNFDKNSW